MGHSLLAQFATVRFREVTLPYINSREKAAKAITRINQVSENDGVRPIVFSTLVDPDIRDMIFDQCDALVLDPFRVFLDLLGSELKIRPVEEPGCSHRISNRDSYEARIEAINFSLAHDDGASVRHYDHAEVILVGVSRSAKTPTCLYLALQFAIRAANYPLTEDDLGDDKLPKLLRPHVDKIYGLTIDPERLRQIREGRRPGSSYASLQQCRYETNAVEEMFHSARIPYANTTTMSVEEIAATIVQERGLIRRAS